MDIQSPPPPRYEMMTIDSSVWLSSITSKVDTTNTNTITTILTMTLCSSQSHLVEIYNLEWHRYLKPLSLHIYEEKSKHWSLPPSSEAFWNTVSSCMKEQYCKNETGNYYMKSFFVFLTAVQGYENEWILVDYPVHYWVSGCVFQLRRSKLVHVPSGSVVLVCDFGMTDNCSGYQKEFDYLQWHPQLDPITLAPVLQRNIIPPTWDWGMINPENKSYDYSKRVAYWGWPAETGQITATTCYRVVWTQSHRQKLIAEALKTCTTLLISNLWQVVFDYAWPCATLNNKPLLNNINDIQTKKENKEEKIKIKNCPGDKCGWPTEKKGGCNFIRCPFCKTRWCWVCNREKGNGENQCYNRKHRSHR